MKQAAQPGLLLWAEGLREIELDCTRSTQFRRLPPKRWACQGPAAAMCRSRPITPKTIQALSPAAWQFFFVFTLAAFFQQKINPDFKSAPEPSALEPSVPEPSAPEPSAPEPSSTSPKYLRLNLPEPHLNICAGTFCTKTCSTGAFGTGTRDSALQPFWNLISVSAPHLPERDLKLCTGNLPNPT